MSGDVSQMVYKDGEVFTTYCDKPYNQNQYKMVLNNGKFVIYDDYDMMRAWWFKNRKDVSHVEILDK